MPEWSNAIQSALGISTPNSRQDADNAKRWLTANIPAVNTVRNFDPVATAEEWYNDPKRKILENTLLAMSSPMAGTLPEPNMLIPATVRGGKVYTPPVMGKSHYDATQLESRAILPENPSPAGFLDSAGNYMDRRQSLEWLKENAPDTYRRLDNVTRKNGLESQAYNHAAGLQTEEAAAANEFMRQLYGRRE